MTTLKRIIKFFSYLTTTLLIIYIGLMTFIPENVTIRLNYKFYTVLTNSMEPTIPTNSLVCVKAFEEDDIIKLEPGEIITFHANRFGHDIILTHRFNKTEVDEEGNTIYRTNAEGKEILDAYETKRSDLIGTYVFHVPYFGKLMLFLKSKFSFVLYGELATIILINNLIKARLEEKFNDSTKDTEGIAE